MGAQVFADGPKAVDSAVAYLGTSLQHRSDGSGSGSPWNVRAFHAKLDKQQQDEALAVFNSDISLGWVTPPATCWHLFDWLLPLLPLLAL